MYLIVSAFRADQPALKNLEATATLLVAAHMGVESGLFKDAALVSGGYKDQREVSVRLDLLGGTTTTEAARQAAIFARELEQETVAVVDSGVIHLIAQSGSAVAVGELQVHEANLGVPAQVDSWTTTTGPNSLVIYSTDLAWYDVPK